MVAFLMAARTSLFGTCVMWPVVYRAPLGDRAASPGAHPTVQCSRGLRSRYELPSSSYAWPS